MNRLTTGLLTLAVAGAATVLALAGNPGRHMAHGGTAQDGAPGSTGVQSAPVWPPRWAQWSGVKSKQDAAAVLGLAVKDGKTHVSCRFKENKDGYGFFLLTVLAFSDDRFLGCHQRFEEQAAETVSGQITIPKLPDKTTKVVIRYRSFAFDRKQWPEKRLSHWYRFTWSRFTTAVPLGERHWNWRFVRGPVDCSLRRWLADSKARFSEQTEATTVIMKKGLPKHG